MVDKPQGEKETQKAIFCGSGYPVEAAYTLGWPEREPTMNPSLLLAFPLLLALSAPCSACLCKLQHPQEYYCNSDIVLLVYILGPGNNTVLKRSFKVTVTKILKGPKTIPEIEAIYTPKQQEDCGFHMKSPSQSQLLIAGFLRSGRVNFTKCHMVYDWERLTREQKIGFEEAYRAACKCRVQPCLLCSMGCPSPELTQCVWKQGDCNYRAWKGNLSSSMCVPSASGHCEWASVLNYQPQS